MTAPRSDSSPTLPFEEEEVERLLRLLEKGVSIETVSVLLGHSNIGITLKHYRPWVKSLQEKLEREVASAWT